MKQYVVFSIAVLLASCGSDSPKEERPVSVLPELSNEIKRVIEKQFPGAKPYEKAIDSLLSIVSGYGIKPDQILWGQSTCVDDITNTKNKLIHPEIKGPFTIGGLGGIPFTGVTGIGAFSHHVPADGTALVFVAPHIGISSEGWGKIVRHGQNHASSCCGALVAALNKLKRNELKDSALSEDDYQENTIEHLALAHKEEILSAEEPLVQLTRVVFKESEWRVTRYVKQARERHFPYAVVVTGVIINTDYQLSDYLWVQRVAVKDINKDVWIKE